MNDQGYIPVIVLDNLDYFAAAAAAAATNFIDSIVILPLAIFFTWVVTGCFSQESVRQKVSSHLQEQF